MKVQTMVGSSNTAPRDGFEANALGELIPKAAAMSPVSAQQPLGLPANRFKALPCHAGISCHWQVVANMDIHVLSVPALRGTKIA